LREARGGLAHNVYLLLRKKEKVRGVSEPGGRRGGGSSKPLGGPEVALSLKRGPKKAKCKRSGLPRVSSRGRKGEEGRVPIMSFAEEGGEGEKKEALLLLTMQKKKGEKESLFLFWTEGGGKETKDRERRGYGEGGENRRGHPLHVCGSAGRGDSSSSSLSQKKKGGTIAPLRTIKRKKKRGILRPLSAMKPRRKTDDLAYLYQGKKRGQR